MGQKINVFSILFRKPEKRARFVRSGNKLEDNIKRKLKEMNLRMGQGKFQPTTSKEGPDGCGVIAVLFL